MTPTAGSSLVGLLGLAVLRLALTDAYLRYVKAGLRPWLLLAGGFLVLLAALRLARAGDASAERVPGAAWLLWLPIALVLVVLPAPLGAYSAARQSANRLPAFSVDPLPAPRDGAVDVGIADLVGRVANFPTTVDGVPLRLVGFVTPDRAGGFRLTRFWMTCCAADSLPVQVRVEGAEASLPANTWVEVVGRWRSPTGRDGTELPAILPDRIRRIARPANPYAN